MMFPAILWVGTAGGGGGGPVTMGGDCSGSSSSCTVVKLQGRAVAATAPTNAQALLYSTANSRWEPTTLPAPSAAQVVPLGLAGSLSVAGSGALAVSTAQWAYSYLDLTGALTGDRTLTLDVAPGRRCLIRNSATDWHLGWLRIVGAGGGSTYLAPGQSKLLWLDASGVLQGEDLNLWRCQFAFAATSGGPGSVVVATVRTPPGLLLSPVRGRTTTAVVAASAPPALRAGISGTGSDEVMRSTGVPTGVGTGFGGANASTGSAADDGGQVDLGSSQTLTLTLVHPGLTSAGAAVARVLGETIG